MLHRTQFQKPRSSFKTLKRFQKTQCCVVMVVCCRSCRRGGNFPLPFLVVGVVSSCIVGISGIPHCRKCGYRIWYTFFPRCNWRNDWAQLLDCLGQRLCRNSGIVRRQSFRRSGDFRHAVPGTGVVSSCSRGPIRRPFYAAFFCIVCMPETFLGRFHLVVNRVW